ncbi:primosomal protein N' [Peribacillus huizhouensis]|uniref:Primosomal protein N n=1 Tax=Peribacillus huizhouensis TaxID=1501239 RepID=A0ABR6CTD9_9BACI|nr:primosomal protein N' [Peribacillus huizhouensis]
MKRYYCNYCLTLTKKNEICKECGNKTIKPIVVNIQKQKA